MIHGTSWPFKRLMGLFTAFIAVSGLAPTHSRADSTTITLLHTNDLHSHYHADKEAPYLGGIARLKTLIDQYRKTSPHSLLVDGGDWTEGQIYYNLGAGKASYEMMGHMGYDVAVLGNHDWLNGPDILMKALLGSGISTEVVASNVDLSAYSNAASLRARIPEYTIREIAGVRIGFIGLLTFEFIYDQFLKPVKLLSPFEAAQKLSEKLKKELGVDYVIALSHNSLTINRKVLEVAPFLDVIVGAHDHKKVTKPIWVDRQGAPKGLLVETGSWGRYLGKIELSVDTQTSPKVSAKAYELVPVAPKVAEDPETAARVTQLESLLEQQYSAEIFHDHIADCQNEVPRQIGAESPNGKLVTRAIQEATHTDLSIDHARFVYGSLNAGPVRTADVMNVVSALYNPDTGKAWTMKVLPIKGSTLNWLFNLLFSPQKLIDGEAPSFAGVDVVYDSVFRSSLQNQYFMSFPTNMQSFFMLDATPVIKQMKINGQDLQIDHTYSMGMSGGLFKTLEFLNSLLPGIVPLTGIQETGQETWRALKDLIVKRGPVSWSMIEYGDHIKTTQADLAIMPGTTHIKVISRAKDHARVQLQFTVKNIGLGPADAQPKEISISGNDPTVSDPLVEIQQIPLRTPLDLGALQPNQAQAIETEVDVPLVPGLNPILVDLKPLPDEGLLSNNQWVFWFDTEQSQATSDAGSSIQTF